MNERTAVSAISSRPRDGGRHRQCPSVVTGNSVARRRMAFTSTTMHSGLFKPPDDQHLALVSFLRKSAAGSNGGNDRGVGRIGTTPPPTAPRQNLTGRRRQEDVVVRLNAMFWERSPRWKQLFSPPANAASPDLTKLCEGRRVPWCSVGTSQFPNRRPARWLQSWSSGDLA